MLLHKRILSFVALGSVSGLLGPLPIYADTIAVIGTGDVARALGPEFAAQGHILVYGSRNPARDEVRALVERTGDAASATTPAESVVGADIVVMAVPGAIVEAVTGSLGNLTGKVIVDPTIAIDRHANGILTLSYDTSAAQLIQHAAPGAHVVKVELQARATKNPTSQGRRMALKVVGAGLGRTSTVSLKVALEELGIGRCYHIG